MLKHISNSLLSSKKYRLWQEAYWLVLVNQALETFVKQHLNLENLPIKAFVKLQGENLHIKVVANDPTVLTALKITQDELLEFFKQQLHQRQPLVPNLNLTFQVK